MPSASETHFRQFAIQWASVVLLYYDYALTFPQEVKYIWRGSKKSLLVVLYVLCRYALLANVLYLLAIADKFGGDQACDAAYKIIDVVSVFGRAAVVFTLLARVYVVCARNKFISGGLGAVAMTVVILDIIHVPGVKCKSTSSIPIFATANTLLQLLVCVFEALAALFTLYRSVQALRFGLSPISTKRHTFNYLVAEQGILYFVFISVFTIAATVLSFRAPGALLQRFTNAFTLPLSGLITARFILRLRAYHARGTLEDSALATPSVSTFEVAARQNSRTIFDEFGEDPLQVASRTVDQETGEYAAHGLRFAINRGERPDCEADINQTATYVGSEYRSMSSGRDRHEMVPTSLDRRQGEFQEGCSGRQTDELVEGCSSA